VPSSQIEGTQATLVDLLNFKSGNDLANPDINEVCNYVEALNYAREQLASKRGLPLSTRSFNETHRLLMRGVRGAGKAPDGVRRSQNWIGCSRPGNAAFVPPPPGQVPKALEMLEKYIHGADSLPPVVRAGLVHVQFETIHPYLRGRPSPAAACTPRRWLTNNE
jgi:Fic family protein